MDAHLARGEGKEVMLILLRDAAGMSDEEIEHFRASPQWPSRVAAAHTVPRKFRAEEGWAFGPGRYRDFRAPTLLLVGSESSGWAKHGTEIVHAALPGSRVVVMDGEEHIAIMTAPDLFVREVVHFLTE